MIIPMINKIIPKNILMTFMLHLNNSINSNKQDDYKGNDINRRIQKRNDIQVVHVIFSDD